MTQGDEWVVAMPKLGETVTEGTIGNWFKQVGDTVAFDDPLFEVSTDKVDSEIPSPYDGVLLEILVQGGETVPVGTVLARIAEPGAAPAAEPGPPPAPAGAAAVVTNGSGASAVGQKTAGAHTDSTGRLVSPLVRELGAEAGLDPAAIPGTGAGGRIRREDVQQAIASGTAGVSSSRWSRRPTG